MTTKMRNDVPGSHNLYAKYVKALKTPMPITTRSISDEQIMPVKPPAPPCLPLHKSDKSQSHQVDWSTHLAVPLGSPLAPLALLSAHSADEQVVGQVQMV